MQRDQAKLNDLQISYDKPLSEALVQGRQSAISQRTKPQSPNKNSRALVRRSLLEPEAKDPRGWERLIGLSNLVSINFLDRGRRAADAVCMIRVPAPEDGWRGTGFLVGQRLLMTNHHVLGTLAEASQAEAEFGYEMDADGVPKHPVRFNLAPHEIFYTDRDLDITLVSVNRYSDADVPLERYGRLPLIPMQGKVLNGEEVSIIQHPHGETKQIAIRASNIIDISGKNVPRLSPDYFEKFIHYSTDTQPGSSGAPVFNDSWQVIAIHHKAIPDWSKMPKGIKSDSETGEIDPDKIKWLANEGVRISAIYRKLEQSRFSDSNAAAVLARLEEAIGLVPLIDAQLGVGRSREFERDRKPYDGPKWTGLSAMPGFGYQHDFLEARSLPLEDVLVNSMDRVAPLKDGSSLLHYLHFSSAIDRDRKFPLITAVNIRGDKLFHPGERSSTWRRDARIDDEYQPDQDFYGEAKGTVDVEFDRGHLVRRLDPCWGSPEEAKIADEHSFHYTNTAPQVHGYNDADWGNLEDYVLNQTQTKEKRVTIFSGPVFREDDPQFTLKKDGRSFKIPVSFWKIAVIGKSPTEIAAVGFMLGQIKYIQALYEARVFSNLKPYTVEELKKQNIQVPISTIEEATDLNFGALKDVDALDALEASKRVRFIRGISDIIL